MDALHVQNLKKSFCEDFYKKPTTVLHDVTFSVRKGCFTGLIGPNGAGKTTTIKCLLEFIFPDAGQIRFFDSDDLFSARQRIGFLPERPYFQEFLTAKEFLKLHWDLSISKNRKAESFTHVCADLLDLVRLKNVQDKKLKSFSKGMLQRIGIAQALMSSPEFLI